MSSNKRITSVAVIGAGAAGAVTAAALHAEDYFDKIRVFERRETAGGTWIYDAERGTDLPVHPGALPSDIDRPPEIPRQLPATAPPSKQERYSHTPVYGSLTTNVPDVAMCYSDSPFAYGPFVPHHVPRQYVENYFATHGTDPFLVLNTTVEDVSRLPPAPHSAGWNRWRLTLRQSDPVGHVDRWWQEDFDALIMANGHYSVPYVPYVKGLEAYAAQFPGRVMHSKVYRSPHLFADKRVLIIGNSASGRDLSAELVQSCRLPLYQSRRSASRWDGDEPPAGIEWKPTVKEYLPPGSAGGSGKIVFDDGTTLDGIDAVIYCTGYKTSFPFWNSRANGRPLWDYAADRIVGGYWHTFFGDFPSLGIVGLPRVLTFRSFEYQAIALARIFAGRTSAPLPPLAEQQKWARERAERTTREGKKFHDIAWETGETFEWLGRLFDMAGLGTLRGDGRVPPPLDRETIWAIEHVRKYPEPGTEHQAGGVGDGWVLVARENDKKKDLLAFI